MTVHGRSLVWCGLIRQVGAGWDFLRVAGAGYELGMGWLWAGWGLLGLVGPGWAWFLVWGGSTVKSQPQQQKQTNQQISFDLKCPCLSLYL